jgi:hypothetical protein
MSNREIVPALGLKSFTCPHIDCGAIAHQTWFKVYAENYDDQSGPWLPTQEDIENFARQPETISTINWLEKLARKEVFFEKVPTGSYHTLRTDNLYLTRCFSCKGVAIWRADELIYPVNKISVRPVDDMPPDVRADYVEANEILDKSPRGAAALLRLCIQKLMPHLGQKGDNINGDIASLVQKGLDTRIQKALDVVRVVGNNAVHPGQIDLRDDKTLAIKLLGLVNVIVESQITQAKHIEEMYENIVPESIKAQIEKRDAPKQIADQSTKKL